MEFAVGQNEKQPRPDRLGFLAFGAVEFAGDELTELSAHCSAMMLSRSRKTRTGDWAESMG